MPRAFRQTAFVLVGFQNDYFATDGVLRGFIEGSDTVNNALNETIALLHRIEETEALIVETPIVFTPGYLELIEPVGILESIRQCGAFSEGSSGAETVDEVAGFGDRLVRVPGKRGLNAFSNTKLEDVLREHEVEHVVLCGAVTSICIDSTGRSAHERGFRVTVLEDCTCARSPFEQEFYCRNIFPLYATVTTSAQLLAGENL